MNAVAPRQRLLAPRRGDPVRLRAVLRFAVSPARARRDSGLPDRRRGGRAAGAQPGRRRPKQAPFRRDRHHLAALPGRARAQSGAAVAVAARHFRLWARPGRAVRAAGRRADRAWRPAPCPPVRFPPGHWPPPRSRSACRWRCRRPRRCCRCCNRRGAFGPPFGERAFSILLFQDLSIVPLITIIAAMSHNPADAGGPPGWQLALYTLAAIVGLVLAGRYALRPLFRLIGNLGEREMFVFAGLFTVVASAAVMELLGLSTALGAFIAGVMPRRFALPARARGRCRAVPLDPLGPPSSSPSAWCSISTRSPIGRFS